jgi:hypothetical protein
MNFFDIFFKIKEEILKNTKSKNSEFLPFAYVARTRSMRSRHTLAKNKKSAKKIEK